MYNRESEEIATDDTYIVRNPWYVTEAGNFALYNKISWGAVFAGSMASLLILLLWYLV